MFEVIVLLQCPLMSKPQLGDAPGLFCFLWHWKPENSMLSLKKLMHVYGHHLPFYQDNDLPRLGLRRGPRTFLSG